jgi:hypothetical protein
MEEESIFVLIGIICILGFVYLLHYISNREGFEDIRMDLGDGDRGSDAWYEKGTNRAGTKIGTVVPNDKKEVVEPSQTPATASAAPAIREVVKAAPAAQAAPARQAAPAPQGAPARQAAPAPQAARVAPPSQAAQPAAKREGAPARTADMPSISESPVESTKIKYAPIDNSNIIETTSGAEQPDAGPELTAANRVKPAIPQINSRVNEDMCRVVMNCGLTKL